MHTLMLWFVNGCQQWGELQSHRRTSSGAFRCCAGGGVADVCLGDLRVSGLSTREETLSFDEDGWREGNSWSSRTLNLLARCRAREGRVGHGFLPPYLCLPVVVWGSTCWGIQVTIVFSLMPLVCQGSPTLYQASSDDGIVASSSPPVAMLFTGPVVKYFECRYSVFKFRVCSHIRSGRCRVAC